MQLSILALNLVYGAFGVVLMYLSYRIIDKLTPEVDFPAELKQGNIAVAIFIAALFLSIALIVGRALGESTMKRCGMVAVALAVALNPRAVVAQDSPLARAARAAERVAQARQAKKMSGQYDPTFRKYTKRFFGPGFDWKLFKAQGFAESRLDSNATSWVGARGIMQLMPSTYKEIASHRPEFGPIDQPEWNIAAGIMHDRYLWNLWGKQVGEADRHHFMFASYNAGEGTIGRALSLALTKGGTPEWTSVERIAPTVQRWRYAETLGYVRKIDSTYAKLVSGP